MNADTRSDLVDSDDVIGTNVYDASGEHVGKVERLVLGKMDGRVAYAVLSFGGLWGLGSDYYPIPWSELSYDADLDGFRINISKEHVENGPKYHPDVEFDWSAESGSRIHHYYQGRS